MLVLVFALTSFSVLLTTPLLIGAPTVPALPLIGVTVSSLVAQWEIA
jgi:hypothetical protein